ncbi:ANTAR domain-containing protein [Catellatospora coxensis]
MRSASTTRSTPKPRSIPLPPPPETVPLTHARPGSHTRRPSGPAPAGQCWDHRFGADRDGQSTNHGTAKLASARRGRLGLPRTAAGGRTRRLRRAMRTRGLIEQAKGLLAERHGCDPETAFGRLSAMSQQRNISVVDLAADLVGATVPDTAEAQDPPTPTAPALDLPGHSPAELRTVVGLADDPDHTLPQDQARVLRKCLAALDAAHDFAALADALVTIGLGGPPGAAAALFSAETDGAVRLVASHGWPAQVASEWQRSPSSLNTTVGAAVRTGRPLLLDGLRPHDFVLIGPGPARAVYPLAVGGHVVGVLSLIWAEAREFTATDLAYLDRLAAGTGRAVRRLWPTAGTRAASLPVWLAGALDVMGGLGHLLTPVRDEHGTVTDFVIAAAGPAVRASDGDTIGRLLLDVYPRLRVNGVFDAYVALLTDDVPFARQAVVEDALVNGRPRRVILNRRAARVGDALLASWERIDATVSNDARMARLETLSRSGWAEWDLQAGDAVWSPGLYGLVGRDQAHGPTTLDKFGSFFAAADRGLLRELLAGLAQGRPTWPCCGCTPPTAWCRYACSPKPTSPATTSG